MVLEAALDQRTRVKEVAPVEDDGLLQCTGHGVEVRAAELLPLGGDQQGVSTVQREQLKSIKELQFLRA